MLAGSLLLGTSDETHSPHLRYPRSVYGALSSEAPTFLPGQSLPFAGQELRCVSCGVTCSLSLESMVPWRMFLGGTGVEALEGQRGRYVKGNTGWRLREGTLESDSHNLVPCFTILLCKLAYVS